MTAWHILTGEYPPMAGGVSDYTRVVAGGLAAAGDGVVVWVPRGCDGSVVDPGVEIRRLPDHFGWAGRAAMDAGIPAGARVLVQYVPQAFGAKSMNVGLAGWLWRRRERWAIDVMFHEVAMPFGVGQRLRYNIPAAVHRAMAAVLCRSARRVFVSTEAWRPMVDRAGRRAVVLPVFSNLPEAETQAVRAMRQRLAGGNANLVGHFGTCHAAMLGMLRAAVEATLASGARFAFIGGGSAQAGKGLAKGLGSDGNAVSVTGPLDGPSAAAGVAACDLMVLPFPDGVTTRRSSVMAALAGATAVVTTTGALTEPLWAESGAVRLIQPNRPADVAAAVMQMLADGEARTALAERGHRLYAGRLALNHTIRCLREGLVTG